MEQGNIDVMVVQNPFDMGVQTVPPAEGDDRRRPGDDQGDVPQPGPARRRHLYDRPAGRRAQRRFAGEGRSVRPKVVEFMLLPDFKAWLDEVQPDSS